jgi:murein L,D-transpeptidase YafK
MFRVSALRALAVASIAALLAACSTMGEPKHLRPIPPELLAEMSRKGMTPNSPLFVRIYKQESELEVWKPRKDGSFALLKTYPICRWSGQLGPKTREGDRQTPEGFYTITPRQMNPNSQYFLSFDLGYPNSFDRAHQRTGSALMVHGDCSSRGCYAMTDEQISEIYALARESFSAGHLSFQVQALPFRMTPENMARHRKAPDIAFWRNLKDGADHFDATARPPRVDVCGKRYVFNARPSDPKDKFVATESCPRFEIDEDAATKVAALRLKQETKIADLVRTTPAIRLIYEDGGMNVAFKRTIRQPDGSEQIAFRVNRVSRPEALLNSPQTIVLEEPGDGSDDITASIPRRASEPAETTPTP